MRNFASILILLLSMRLFSQVERIEPPFWFTEMHNPELQLMVYGPNIAQYDVAFSGGIQIKNIVKTENPNYLFLTISTQNIVPKHYELHFSKDNKIIETLLQHCKPTTQLCIAAELTSSTEWIKTKSIADWNKEKVDLHKKPVIYLLMSQAENRK